MSKFNVKLSYKELQIIKHSLGHYLHRQEITVKEMQEENRLLTKITDEVSEIQERCNIQ